MSNQQNKDLPALAKDDQQTHVFGASDPQTTNRRERKSASHAMPAPLAGDILTAAQSIRVRHKELFTADPKLKDRAARLFRTMLPPRPGRPGRKRIASVTIAIRMQKTLTKENPTATRAQIWAKIYPKAIPNYSSLAPEARWMERRRLRDRVHSSRVWRRKRAHREKREG